MSQSRLSAALSGSYADFATLSPVVVFDPGAAADLSPWPRDGVVIVERFFPHHRLWAGRGYDTRADLAGADAPDRAALAVVCLPRARALAKARIHAALTLTGGGPVLIDGQKSDGADSLMRACRKLGQVGAVLSKAHGKTFALSGDPAAFADWADPGARANRDGFVTAPGVFSEDGVDRGSALLAAHLPAGLSGRLADLGAGWGYLSAVVSDRPGLSAIELFEADAVALDCARRNVTDPRAAFHWCDVTDPASLGAAGGFDVILCNPPFHSGRAADPALGIAFLDAAARLLAPRGTAWVVANRQLPYERALAQLFARCERIGEQDGFKLLRLSGAKPPGRPPRQKPLT